MISAAPELSLCADKGLPYVLNYLNSDITYSMASLATGSTIETLLSTCAYIH
jgi:hypothetical protein